MKSSIWLRSKLLKWSRIAYNEKSYSTSLRISRVCEIIYPKDPTFIDISARSALGLSKYSLATKKYRKAEKYGLSLRYHSLNHFKSEVKAGNFYEAFIIMNNSEEKNYSIQIKELCIQLSKLNKSDRVEEIQNIGANFKIPLELAKLLPWEPKKIDLRKEDNEPYYVLNNELLNIDSYRREISRIKNSGTYLVTNLIAESLKSPKNFLMLSFTLPSLLWKIGNEKLGKSNVKYQHFQPLSNRNKDRNCIVLFPTNGVGFGHFTRLLAIAKKIRQKDPDVEIIFFTTMPTLHILSEFGFPAYHLSGRYRFAEMPAKSWNSICEEMLSMILSLHRPKAFIFDGSYPYRGMLNSISSQPNSMLKVWLRRGAIKENSKPIPVDSINKFHAIIRPGDSVESNLDAELNNDVSIIKCNPIIINEYSEMAQKGELRIRFGIPNDATLCYLQLGAGNINDIDSELNWTIHALLQHPEVYVVIGESMLGDRLNFNFPRVRLMRDYPNSKYFNDFDFAIMAGGYNSFHEVIEASLPTICYPNIHTGRDDQLSRAKVAEAAGCMVVIKERTKGKIQIAIDRLVEKDVRDKMKNNFHMLKRQNGSEQVVNWIFEQIKKD